MVRTGDIASEGIITPLPDDLSIASQAQGDVLYFDGANWVKLAAGTEGQLLTAHGAAAPTFETPAGGGSGFSNVIFSYYGIENSVSTARPKGVCNSDGDTTPSETLARTNILISGFQTATVIFVWKWTKIPDVSTATIWARLWGLSTFTSNCIVTIGGQSNTVTRQSGTPGWASSATIDLSSLTNGVTYDCDIRLGNSNTNNDDIYMGTCQVLGS
jgi:hypothetical protein